MKNDDDTMALNKSVESESKLVCPNCNCLSSKFNPYYISMFDLSAYAYFLYCDSCKKTSYLQIIRSNI